MRKTKIALATAALASAPAWAGQHPPPTGTTPVPPTLPGQLVLYQFEDYNGERYMIDGAKSRSRTEWNVGSLAIHPGERWQLCARPSFRGDCIVLDRSVHDASLIGVEGQIGSIRPAPEEAEED